MIVGRAADHRGRMPRTLHNGSLLGVPDLVDQTPRQSGLGVTGVTDATPFDTLDGFGVLAQAVRQGELPQRVLVTGGPDLVRSTSAG